MGVEYTFLKTYAGISCLYKEKFEDEQRKINNKNKKTVKDEAPHCCKLFFMSILLLFTWLTLTDMNDPTLAFWNCEQ